MSKKKHKLSLRKASSMLEVLQEISALEFQGAPLDFLINICENSVVLEPHVKLYNTTRDMIVKQYGEKDAEGNFVIKKGLMQVSDDNFVEFDKKISELLDKEVSVELHSLSKINFENVVGLKPAYLKGILPILN